MLCNNNLLFFLVLDLILLFLSFSLEKIDIIKGFHPDFRFWKRNELRLMDKISEAFLCSCSHTLYSVLWCFLIINCSLPWSLMHFDLHCSYYSKYKSHVQIFSKLYDIYEIYPNLNERPQEHNLLHRIDSSLPQWPNDNRMLSHLLGPARASVFYDIEKKIGYTPNTQLNQVRLGRFFPTKRPTHLSGSVAGLDPLSW